VEADIVLYLYCHCIFNYQEGSVRIPLAGLNPSYYCSCLKSGIIYTWK